MRWTWAVVLVAWLGVSGSALAQIPGGAFKVSTLPVFSGGFGEQWAAMGADGLALVVLQTHLGVTVLHCSDPACSSATVSAIAGGSSSGTMPVVVGADGRGLVAYRGLSGLTVSHCDDVSCSTATTSVLDGQGGFYPAMTVGADGLGLIVDAGGPGGTLRIAHCNNPMCSSATFSTFGQSVTVNLPMAVAIGSDGLPLIAFVQGSPPHALAIAHCTDSDCSAATVTTIHGSGRSPAVAIGPDGFGMISFRTAALPSTLRLARCLDASCATFAVTTVAQPVSDHRSALAVGADGHDLIAFAVDMPGSSIVQLARCSDPACKSVARTTVDLGRPSAALVGRDRRPLLVYNRGFGVGVAHQTVRGDFNPDGRPDILWRREGSGHNLAWLMNGATALVGLFTEPPVLADMRWRLVGTSDFNDDGHTDILWRHANWGQNAVWFMNGMAIHGGELTTPPALFDTHWRVAGTADFDRNGRPDILWRHDISGENVLWYMNGTVLTAGTFLTPPSLPDPNWTVGGVADFDPDGETDILWHHASSGQVLLWYMNGSVLTSSTSTTPPSLPDTDWQISAVGDYDSNGHPDIVWHHQGSGETLLWFMNGATLVNATFTSPSTFPDTNWKLVGPR
jgi:hypothetical protein